MGHGGGVRTESEEKQLRIPRFARDDNGILGRISNSGHVALARQFSVPQSLSPQSLPLVPKSLPLVAFVLNPSGFAQGL